MRQFRHGHHVVWEHPTWKLAGEKRDEIITIGKAAGSGRYNQQRSFAPAGMGHGDHRGFGDIVMR